MQYSGSSPGFINRGGQKSEGGAKNQKGKPHFENTVLDECSNQGAKREMVEHRFQMGKRAPLAPAGDGPDSIGWMLQLGLLLEALSKADYLHNKPGFLRCFRDPIQVPKILFRWIKNKTDKA